LIFFFSSSLCGRRSLKILVLVTALVGGSTVLGDGTEDEGKAKDEFYVMDAVQQTASTTAGCCQAFDAIRDSISLTLGQQLTPG